MQSLSSAEGLAIAMRALMVYCKVTHNRYPVLAEVHAVDTALAGEMSRLGYSEFAPALLEAMVIKRVQKDDDTLKLLNHKAITNFLRSSDGNNRTI
jgi:hypothetical protein